jgi:hypothetical protein
MCHGTNLVLHLELPAKESLPIAVQLGGEVLAWMNESVPRFKGGRFNFSDVTILWWHRLAALDNGIRVTQIK